MGKRKEFEGMQAQGKVGQAEVAEMGQRTDTLSYALLAEINTFHSQRLKDMKLVHQQFLQEQIKFYQKASPIDHDLESCTILPRQKVATEAAHQLP